MTIATAVRPTAEQATAMTGVKVNNIAPRAQEGFGYTAHLNSRTDAYRFAAVVAGAFASDPDAATSLVSLEVLELWPGELAVRVRIDRYGILPNR